jgi:hypothetical protein
MSQLRGLRSFPGLVRAASGNSHDRRRQRRERRQQRKLQTEEHFEVKWSREEHRRSDARREYIDASVSFLSNYSWSHFITLTFRESLGAEAIERAIRRFTRFVHEDVFGKFDPVRDVRDLYGVRYFPAIERGKHATHRLHAHVLICGGEILGDRLQKAKWTPWRKWWNREYGGLDVDTPESQSDVAAYCAKYLLKGDESGFELCSTWADERDWRKRAEAPLLEDRKVGIDVTRSAELERSAFRGEAPNGTGPTAKGSGKPCHRCGLISLCRCWTGTTESGQVNGPESDAGACEGVSGAGTSAAPSPQLDLPMHQQLFFPGNASANKTVLSFRRKRRRLRYHSYNCRSSIYAVVRSSAAYANHVRALD